VTSRRILQHVDPRAECEADDLAGFAPSSVNRHVERIRALAKIMRSMTSIARGAQSAASRLVPTVLATAVVVTAACTDTTPTTVRPNVIVDSASAMVIPGRCPNGCARIVYSHRTSAADV